jgi:uncharacterized protein (AIM24 family)
MSTFSNRLQNQVVVPQDGVRPGRSPLREVVATPLDPLDEGEYASSEAVVGEAGLVGSLLWRLKKGDLWVLAPESAFLFTDCWRKTLVREAYRLDEPATRTQMWRDGIKTIARRWITGEPLLLDLYIAEEDGAELGISSDELGGTLYSVSVERGPIISRKSVYFGSQKGVMLRAESPLRGISFGVGWSKIREILKTTAYGPGWIFQRFVPRHGSDQLQLILQIDGDIYFRDLVAGETLRADPRHAYAWEETVGQRLVKFGSVMDRLLRGSIPFQVEFQGPGRVWLSNMSFSDGYLGHIFTPSHWVFKVQEVVRRFLGYLNPFNWL